MNPAKRKVKDSRRAEQRFADRVGGRRTARSGGYWGMPGDITAPDILAEHKMTGASQITIKAAWLDKIFNEAVASGKSPWLPLQIRGKNYVVLDEGDALALRDLARSAVGAEGEGSDRSLRCTCGGGLGG